MVHTRYMIALPFCLLAGCVGTESTPSPTVSANPFDSVPRVGTQARASFTPADLEVAARVDALGRKIVAGNPQIGLQPQFRTIGTPQPEIFHVGTTEVDVTDGLVKQCRNDGELAAILCHELGKMVSEREALAGPQQRFPDREPPAETRAGNDNAGSFGPSDMTRQAELAKFEKENPRQRAGAAPVLPPDPDKLARIYLANARYSDKELEAVGPLLQSAARNSTLERQMTLSSPVRP